MTSEVEERPRVVIALYGGLGVNGLTKKAQNPNFAEFLAFWGLFGIGSANLSQKDPSFGKLGHVINPLNPELFAKKGVSWTFWCFLGSISVKLPLMRSKMPLHHNSLAFSPLASQCVTFCLGHAQKSKF